MWENFSPAAQRAMAQAEAFARRHGEIERFPDASLVLGLVTADHLLLGVVHPTTGADVWPRLAVDAAALHDALERALVGGVWPPAPTDVPAASVRPAPVDVLLDESARRAVECAAAEARRLRHPDVRPEHLLLGALRVGQARGNSSESLGCLVLAQHGVTLAGVFAVLLAADVASGAGRYAPRPSPFELS